MIWAESNGTSGGIYFGSITTSGTAPAAARAGPAPPTDLPLGG